MGKRIITQRRGKGSLTYRSASHRYHHKSGYPTSDEKLVGTVIELMRDPARTAPTAVIKFNNNVISPIPAPLNLREGDKVVYNSNEYSNLSILKLKEIPDGTMIYNVEGDPGDGGKFCRAGGTAAHLISKTKDYILVKLPSKKERKFNPECKAIIGSISSGGKYEKPLMKAGKRHHIMRARNKLYPKTSGVAMNAVDHPFGSGRGRHVGKSKIPKKNAPPGRNVGLIRSRRTGKKK